AGNRLALQPGFLGNHLDGCDRNYRAANICNCSIQVCAINLSKEQTPGKDRRDRKETYCTHWPSPRGAARFEPGASVSTKEPYHNFGQVAIGRFLYETGRYFAVRGATTRITKLPGFGTRRLFAPVSYCAAGR